MAIRPNVSVTVKRDEPVERALRRFKRLCERAGISKTVRNKRYYEKPSDLRRRETRKSLRNRRRAERKSRERMQRKLDRARKQQRSKLRLPGLEATISGQPMPEKLLDPATYAMPVAPMGEGEQRSEGGSRFEGGGNRYEGGGRSERRPE
jgi:small subunit ribosomal protein S21